MIRAFLIAISVLVLCGAGVLAQPTFGRPRPDGESSPESPAPAPDPELDPGMDAPAPPASGPNTDLFIPSPDEWAESDPPRKAPARDVEPGKTYAWRSADGLRYSYSIPVSYKAGEGYDIVVICHPANSDFRWGIGNNLGTVTGGSDDAPTRTFRPDSIIVSPDGPGALGSHAERRAFPCTAAAAVRFRDFLLELSRTMPGKRIFLYGYGGGGDPELGGAGGQFVLLFSGLFPALSDGVVAYGGGLPTGEGYKIVRSNVPIVLMHGVKNAMVPYAAALEALEANTAEGNRLVRLRALRAYNDYPNPVRVSESIDYLTGVRTDDARECLRCVEALLTPKPPDEYDYTAPVWYAGARELLGRILDEPGPVTGEAPFEGSKSAPEAVKARARELVALIEAEAAKHVEAIRNSMPSDTACADLYLDGGPWLGHLIAARDDFRGVDAMEQFASRIGFDAASESHAAEAAALREAWNPTDEVESFEAAVTHLPRCFLCEAVPVDLVARTKAWKRKAQGAEISIDPGALEGFEHITNWDDGYRRGLDAYRDIWRRWRFAPTKEASADDHP